MKTSRASSTVLGLACLALASVPSLLVLPQLPGLLVGQTLTLPPASTQAVTVNTNGVITSPTNLVTANGLATTSNVATAQTNAETYASNAATAAQSNAETSAAATYLPLHATADAAGTAPVTGLTGMDATVKAAVSTPVNTLGGFPLQGYQLPGYMLDQDVAGMVTWPVEGQVSNGTDTTANTRDQYITPATHAVQDIRTWWANENYGTPGPNPYTIRVAIEYPVGTFTPVFFNGLRDVVVQPGALVVNDPVAVDIPANTLFFVRAFLQVTAGQTWDRSFITYNVPSAGHVNPGPITSGGYVSGVGLSDQTTSGTITNNFTYAIGPVAISGRCADNTNLPAVGVIGDSIAEGPESGGIEYNYQDTWIDRKLYADGYPFINFARAGADLTSQLVTARNQITVASKTCKDIICEIGINNARGANSPTGATAIEADYVQLWTEFTSRGLKVWQTTLTPVSTSTDNWATTANQTQVQPATINAVNDWIRTIPAPLSGYIEVSDSVSTARDSDIWKATGSAQGYSVDGVHPTAAGADLIQNAVTLPTFP